MIQAPEDYGTLAPLVKVIGWLMSASIAIGLSWRRRANWEPVEEDVSRGPARVAGLLTAVAIALIWANLASAEHRATITRLAILFGALTLVFLLTYGAIISLLVFTKVVSTGANQTAEQKIIGGLRQTQRAREVIAKRKLTVQKAFAGALYDPDEIWTRGSRALAKLLFAFCYTGLVVSGSLALTCAGVLLLLSDASVSTG